MAGAVAGAEDVLRVGVAVAGQGGGPAFEHTGLVGDLVGLDADGGVGAVGGAFVVDDFGARFVEDFFSGGADAEGEVGVFVVGGGEGFIEAAERLEEGSGDHDGRAGAVVDFADVVEVRAGRVLVAAVVTAAGVVPDDAAGFLEAAVGVEEFGADQAGVGSGVEEVGQGVDGAGAGFGVVVEEVEMAAAGGSGAAVAA